MNIKDACALDYCYRIGWLAINQKKWQAVDRHRAGAVLRESFLASGLDLKASSFEPRVDSSGVRQPSDKRMRAEDYFRKAIRCMPRDFAPVVLQVCVENKVITGKNIAVDKVDLCRGLDYLCDFIVQKKRGC